MEADNVSCFYQNYLCLPKKRPTKVFLWDYFRPLSKNINHSVFATLRKP